MAAHQTIAGKLSRAAARGSESAFEDMQGNYASHSSLVSFGHTQVLHKHDAGAAHDPGWMAAMHTAHVSTCHPPLTHLLLLSILAEGCTHITGTALRQQGCTLGGHTLQASCCC